MNLQSTNRKICKNPIENLSKTRNPDIDIESQTVKCKV